MKNKQICICCLATMLTLRDIPAHSQDKDAIFYSSLNYAVQLGQFDGVASVKELKQNGDFAVGSQHALTGELVMLNGKAYRISVDGKASLMPDTASLPFAATKFFRSEKSWKLDRPLNLQQLHTFLDSIIDTDRFIAIKISGKFSSVKYKCYYPQAKPYPPIKDTPAKIFDSTNIGGTMVGFFTPKSAMVLNSPNYHFHFINAFFTSGGHVDDVSIRDVKIELDYATSLQVRLPSAESLKSIDLNQEIKE